MKTTHLKLPEHPPKTYSELVRLYPPRKIRDAADLANATEIIDWLSVRAGTKDQFDYCDLVGDLVADYEEQTIEPLKDSTPLELLNYLVEEHKLSTRALGKILGVNHSMASRILTGERSITIEHAKTLGNHFKLAPAAFLEL